MKIDVLYQFNENYAPFAGVSITSLFENNKELNGIRVFILGEGLSEDTIYKFTQTAIRYHREILFIMTLELIEKMKKLGMPTYRGSYAANMRLFLSDVLPGDVNRLLYLDADTVINQSIEELMSIDMEEHALGMVLDSLADFHKREIGLSKEDNYYNSGVILFQMEEWKRKNFSERIVEHIKNVRTHYPSPDQDLLNVVCREEIKLLPPQYNLQPIHLAFALENYYRYYRNKNYYKMQQIEAAKVSPVIFHFFRFIGEFPWHENNSHPCSELFDRYLEKSDWKEYSKKRAKVGNFIKIEKILYGILPESIFLTIFKVAHLLYIYNINQSILTKSTHNVDAKLLPQKDITNV